MADSGRIDLERVFGVLRRRWWVVVLLTVVVGGAAFAFSRLQHKQYTATASVLFSNQALQQQAAGLPVLQTSPSQDPQIMATNIQLLTSQSGVAAATAREVGRGLSASGVSRAISVSQSGQTSVARVSATSHSPALAAAIANAYVGQFISRQRVQQQASVAQALALVDRQIKGMSSQQLAGTNGLALLDRAESLRVLARLQNGGAQVVTPATVPSSPSSPKVARNTALGLVIGLLLGVTLMFLLDRFDRRIKDVDELQAAYRLPLLAAVPQSKVYAAAPRVNGLPDRGEREVFRQLRAYLRYFNVDRELRSLLVASAAPGDGKSTVARNLAQAAQESGTKTLLIEADLRGSEMAHHYGLRPAPGLSELLVGSAQRRQAIRSVPVSTRVNGDKPDVSLDVLVAGTPPPNPSELIESQAMAELLSWASENYQLVIVDTPPLAVVSDTISLLGRVDGVLVVSQLGKNSRDAAASLRERLKGINAPLLGVIANRVKTPRKSGLGYPYPGHHRPPTSQQKPEYV
ncbi:MAG: polysaccharide biosynthesis tyrosine autokinase, partial [Solirubrobacteraceae bacterium]